MSFLSPADDLLFIPAIAGILLLSVSNYRVGAWLNILASLMTLLAAGWMLIDHSAPAGQMIAVDDLSISFLALNALVGFTTSCFGKSYIAHDVETGRLKPSTLRYYYALYQLLVCAMNLALLTRIAGLMWVAIEMATLITVVMVGIYRTHEALEAAWKYFMLGGVGIALALFGTIIVYLAAQPFTGAGLAAMSWDNLVTHAASFDPLLLDIAFVFILVGYGTKAGLVPLHAWLPDAHAEGPTPISAILSGLLLNLALYAILRFKIILAANPAVFAPGPMMIVLGMASIFIAALMLYRRRGIKRFFAYSSIEHVGIITLAFGIGGPLANFAGLLHMAMHSLAKSGLFFTIGHIVRIKGSQKFADISGLTISHPALGWVFVAGVIAIAGLPPFGVFTSEFLVVSSAFTWHPLLALILVVGLLISLGGLILRLNETAFGSPGGSLIPDRVSLWPAQLHFALVLIAGIYLPGPITTWFQHVAKLLG
ncbi:MAG: hydrogenase 4 subunit F [Rhizomicrobium sp.]